MKMRVLGNRILVKRLDPPKTKSSIIEVVEMNPDPSQYGKVLGIGIIEANIKVGDIVLLGQYSGARVDLDGQEAFVVPVEDVLGVVEK